MSAPKNLRDYSPSTSTGSDVKDTSQLSGEAAKSKGWTDSNETVQYTASNMVKGPGKLGGEDAKI